MSAIVLGNYCLLAFVVCTVIYVLCYLTIVGTVKGSFGKQVKLDDGSGCFIAIPLFISAIGSRVGLWGAAVCYTIAFLQYLEVL